MSEQPIQPTQQNDITAVRDVLFQTLRSLSDKDKPMDIDRAVAIKDVAQTIINSAKVEVDALKVIGGNGTGFIPPYLPGTGKGGAKPVAGVLVHKLGD